MTDMFYFRKYEKVALTVEAVLVVPVVLVYSLSRPLLANLNFFSDSCTMSQKVIELFESIDYINKKLIQFNSSIQFRLL